jgi:predicted RNA-binding protein YlqC (UPF0109 family)
MITIEAEAMQKLVGILAKALVDNPQAVRVECVDRGDTAIVEITVAQEDMGKVIGKQGRIVKAIRTVAKAAGARSGKRVSVEVL